MTDWFDSLFIQEAKKALESKNYTGGGGTTGGSGCDCQEMTEDDAMELLIEMDIVNPVTDENGAMFTDETGAIFTL